MRSKNLFIFLFLLLLASCTPKQEVFTTGAGEDIVSQENLRFYISMETGQSCNFGTCTGLVQGATHVNDYYDFDGTKKPLKFFVKKPKRYY